jgi:hypothetical protein
MIKASYKDKSIVVDILTDSFDSNKSVNYVIKQDNDRLKRIKFLMEYSFEICFMFGEIYLSDDRRGCALILFPERKRTTTKTIVLDLKLVLSSIGLRNINKVLKRESKIKELHPMTPYYHLWFIGVTTTSQKKGIGSKLLMEIVKDNKFSIRDIYLETSTIENIPWYQNLGFSIVQQLDLGYQLYCLKKVRKH